MTGKCSSLSVESSVATLAVSERSTYLKQQGYTLCMHCDLVCFNVSSEHVFTIETPSLEQ